jgi:protein-S-isoprenylcysteine O-methyltransferase Ste14
VNRRVLRVLLALYPREFRDRYGAEIAGLADEMVMAGDMTVARAGFNLAAGAAAERCRVLVRSGLLLAAVAVVATLSAVLLAAPRAGHSGTAEPYFDKPGAGAALVVLTLCLFLLEFIEFLRVQEWRGTRPRATPVRRRTTWLVGTACIVAAEAWLYLAPRIAPGATIRPGAVAFGGGMVIFAAGIALRGWSFKELGRCFSYAIAVSRDLPVISTGPYRLIRHPSYAGGLLICIGLGLTSANWISLAAMTLLPLAALVWLIHVEESALVTTLQGRYRSYAFHTKHLVPLVW